GGALKSWVRVAQSPQRLLTVRIGERPRGDAPLDQDPVWVFRIDRCAPTVVDLRHIVTMGQPPLLVFLDLVQAFGVEGDVVGPVGEAEALGNRGGPVGGEARVMEVPKRDQTISARIVEEVLCPAAARRLSSHHLLQPESHPIRIEGMRGRDVPGRDRDVVEAHSVSFPGFRAKDRMALGNLTTGAGRRSSPQLACPRCDPGTRSVLNDSGDSAPTLVLALPGSSTRAGRRTILS